MVENFLTILGLLAPVFLLAACGALWSRLGFAFDVSFATQLVMLLAGPALVFITLAEVKLPARDLGAIAVAALIGHGVLALAAALALRIAELPTRVHLAPMVFGNTGNVGLPVAFFALGPDGLAAAVVVFTVSTLLVLSGGVWAMSGRAAPVAIFEQPIVYAAVFGALAAVLAAPIPSWLGASFTLAGQIAIPLMLLTLGVAVARLALVDTPLMVALAVGRLALSGLSGVAAVEIVGLEGIARDAVILQFLTPAAVMTYVLAQREGAHAQPQKVAAAVLVSTLVAFVALPVALVVLAA